MPAGGPATREESQAESDEVLLPPGSKKTRSDFNGIFRLADGKLQVLYKELTHTNRLAFSPDEKYFCVANSYGARNIRMRFEVQPDGTIANGTVFHDATQETEPGSPDGIKVDKEGTLTCTGPGGVSIFSPEGKHLGTIKPPEIPSNCTWGDADGEALTMTARTWIYRIRLEIGGSGLNMVPAYLSTCSTAS